MWGIPLPDPSTEDGFKRGVKELADKADGYAEATGAPCDEHRAQVKQAADLLRGVADEIDAVQKDRAG